MVLARLLWGVGEYGTQELVKVHGDDGERSISVYIFCWVPLTGQTQLEHGKQRHSADVLQRHQVLEDGSLGTNETNPGND